MTQRYIEIFPGLISDLERMTGREYEAVKKEDGSLQKCLINFSTTVASTEDFNKALQRIAFKNAYDAYVHVQRIFENKCYVTIGYPVRLKKISL